MCIINGDVHQFIDHCIIPLDPWLQNLSKLINIRTKLLHINLIRLQIKNTKRKRPREQGLGNDEGKIKSK